MLLVSSAEAHVKIGIGLPSPVPGTSGRVLIEWARRAEERGFSSAATIDRIAYPSYESLIVLEPTRNPVLLAKEAASVDQISEGRLVLGLGVGTRRDDYELVERDFGTRGKRLDRDLEIMHRAWRGELVEGAQKPVGPSPVRGGRVPILIG